MNLLPDVEFREDLALLVWRPYGVIDESAVNRIIRLLGEKEQSSQKPFDRFTDTMAVDAIDLNFRFIFHVSLFRRLSYAGPPVKSAILVRDEDFAHYSRLHAILTQGSALQVRIFLERLKAAKWLAIPQETLE